MTNPASMQYLIDDSEMNDMDVHQNASAKNTGGIGRINMKFDSLILITLYYLFRGTIKNLN